MLRTWCALEQGGVCEVMFEVMLGDAAEQLKSIEDCTINCCVTSPPYYCLRDYGMDGQIGLEESPEQYINKLVDVFREVRRVLRDDGVLWVNIGDSYWGSGSRGFNFEAHPASLSNTWLQKCNVGSLNLANVPQLKGNKGVYKNKDLIGIPWMLAFALRADGWYLRQDIIWHKPNPMPESVKDRCTRSHEYIFMLTKNRRYYFDSEAIQEDAVSDPKRYDYPMMNGVAEQNKNRRPNGATNTGGMKKWTGKRNKRDVWSIPVSNFKGAHFATFPEALVEPCVLSSCPEGGVVLDPFSGACTVGVVSKKQGRQFIGVEINPEYRKIGLDRMNKTETEFKQIRLEI